MERIDYVNKKLSKRDKFIRDKFIYVMLFLFGVMAMYVLWPRSAMTPEAQFYADRILVTLWIAGLIFIGVSRTKVLVKERKIIKEYDDWVKRGQKNDEI